MDKSLKSLAILGLLGLSFNAFSLSESYMIFDNGTVALTKNRASTQNEVNFLTPSFFFNDYNLKIAKTHYLIDKNDTIYTTSKDGFLFEKRFFDIKGRIKEYGGSFFTTSKNQIYVVTSDGFIIRHDAGKEINVKKLDYVGGNFMVTRDDQLVAVRSDGSYADMSSQFKHKASDIKLGGDNYFITEDGTLYSIGEELVEMKDKKVLMSFVYRTSLKNILSKTASLKSISLVGGNYFFDTDYNLHTISSKGVVDQNIVKRKLKIKNNYGREYALIPQIVGSSYFSFYDDIVFHVADDGLYYELGKTDRKIIYTNYNSFKKK